MRTLVALCSRSVVVLLLAAGVAGQDVPAREGASDQKGAPAGDSQSAGPLETRVYPCKHTVANEVARVLRDALGVRRVPLQIAVDDRTNALIVSGHPQNSLPMVLALLQELDRPTDAAQEPSEVVETIVLTGAAPMDVMKSLQGLRSPEARGLRLVADEGGGSLWLAGEPRLVKRFAEIARTMDAAATSRRTESRDLRFYSLKHAHSDRLQKTLRQTTMMMGLDVALASDADSETLIAYATPGQHEQLAGIITRLDVMPKRAPSPQQPAPQLPAAPAEQRKTGG